MFLKEPLQNGISTDGFTGTGPLEKAEKREGGEAAEKGEAGGISKKPRDKPQRQRHLDRELANKEPQRTEEQKEKDSGDVKHQESAEPDVSAADVQTEELNGDLTDSTPACDVAGSIIVFSSVPLHEISTESLQEEYNEPISRLHSELQVPAAPSKPLPVPHPRKPKKPTLVRQDGVEVSAQDPAAEEQTQWNEMHEAEERLSGSHSSEGQEPTQDTGDDSLPQRDSGMGDIDPDAPVPSSSTDLPSLLASTEQSTHRPSSTKTPRTP